jgi:TDG/mug DNA glycosylase family protein
MTDLVKRATRSADALSNDEYAEGVARVERLIRWLRPRAVCLVGFAGWRAAIDKKAKAGEQPVGLGGVPVYVMPNPSGINASSSLDDITNHLRGAGALADRG